MTLLLGLRELYVKAVNSLPFLSLEPHSLALALANSMWLDSLQNLLCSFNKYLLKSSRVGGSVNRAMNQE